MIRLDRHLGLMLSLCVLALFFALGVSVALPAVDPALGLGRDRSFDKDAVRGMRVFASEGCWYCHTTQVRPVSTDAGLGKPLPPGAYEGDQPAMLGAERLGPDLTHAGARLTDRDELEKLLRLGGKGMPSYRHVSRRDLDALISYLQALK